MLLGFTANAQYDAYQVLSGGSTSGNGRAPQGAAKVNKSVWLITAAEMAAAGYTNGMQINGLGFQYQAAQTAPTTSTTYNVYLENVASTVVANAKSTTWATAISTMTLVNNANITVPASTGYADFMFAGGSTFTYTGGAIYVAFDYQNTGTPDALGNVAFCNTAITGGLKGALNATGAAITTVAASNFRPVTRLLKAVACSRPTNLSATAVYTNTTAQLSWTAGTGGTVDFEYGPYNYIVGNGTTTTAVASPYTQSGLTASTPYEYYVRKNCSGAGYSVWEGPYPFHTTFLPIDPTYNTGFNYDDLPMIGWKNEPTTDNSFSDWYAQYGAASPTGLVQEGVASAFSVIGVTTAPLNTWMYSRGVNLTAGSTVTVSWYDKNYQSGTTTTALYNVTYGIAQYLGEQVNTVAAQVSTNSTTWTLKSYTFTAPSTGVFYFGFQNVTAANAAGTHALGIDNFTVTEVLATDSFVNNKFSVSPNPTTGLINVTNNEGINVNEITVTDLNGRVIKTSKFNNVSNISINISDLSAGIYMMNIKSEAGTATKKVVKE